MSAGEVVVWCVGLICITLLCALGLIVIAYKASDKAK